MQPRVLSLTGYHGTSPPEHCSRCSPSKKLAPRKWPDAEPTCHLPVGALVPALVSLSSFVSPCLVPPANAQVAPAAVSVAPTRDWWRDAGQRCPAAALLVATVEEGDAPHQPAQRSFMGDRACPSACPPRSQPQLSRRLASRDTYHPSFMQLPTCPLLVHTNSNVGPSSLELQRGGPFFQHLGTIWTVAFSFILFCPCHSSKLKNS